MTPGYLAKIEARARKAKPGTWERTDVLALVEELRRMQTAAKAAEQYRQLSLYEISAYRTLLVCHEPGMVINNPTSRAQATAVLESCRAERGDAGNALDAALEAVGMGRLAKP